jgi:preprotein translocase subunit SecE
MGNRRGSTTRGGARKTQQDKRRRPGAGMMKFAQDVRGEIRRVNWPDRDQLRQSTAVVLIIVLALTVYVSVWDFVFQNLARLIFA